MNSVIRIFVVSIISVSMIGCVVNPTRKAISEKDARTIRSTQVVSIISQDEITANVVNPNISGAAGGGLLVALIDASIIESRTAEAEGYIAPLRQGLAGLDFRKEYWKRQSQLFVEKNWIKSGQPKNTAVNMGVTQIRDTVSSMQEDAFLIMKVDYHLSSDFKRMVVENYAQLWTRGEDLPTYAARIEYQSAAIPADDKSAAVDYWNKDGARAAYATLYEGMDEVLKILKMDLFKNRGVAIAGSGEKISLPYAHSDNTFIHTVDGEVIEKNDKRYIIKAGSGRLLSLSRHNEFTIPEITTQPASSLAAVSTTKNNSEKKSKAKQELSPIAETKKKTSDEKPVFSRKPIVLVTWAEPGSADKYATTSIDVYSRKLSGVMKGIINQFYQENREIISVNGASATHIAEQVSQEEPSASLCKAKDASYVVTGLTGTSDADNLGASQHSRLIEYHFHDCLTSNHFTVSKYVENTRRDRFRFEKGYSAAFKNFMSQSISASRKVTQRDE